MRVLWKMSTPEWCSYAFRYPLVLKMVDVMTTLCCLLAHYNAMTKQEATAHLGFCEVKVFSLTGYARPEDRWIGVCGVSIEKIQ